MDARVTALPDEELIDAVRRTLIEVLVPHLNQTVAEEFVISEVKACLSILDHVSRGLPERQAARESSDRQLAELFDQRPLESAWHSSAPQDTGAFLALARISKSNLSEADRRLAGEVRSVLRSRLRVEVDSHRAPR